MSAPFAQPAAGPAEIGVRINGDERRLAAGATLGAVLAGLGLDARAVAVERNGEIVRRDALAGVILEDGDRLEVVRFVQGG